MVNVHGLRKRPARGTRSRRAVLATIVSSAAVLALSGFGAQSASFAAGEHAAGARGQLASLDAATVLQRQGEASGLTSTPTLPTQGAAADIANLPVLPARMTCADLAKTTTVAGQSIQITEQQTTSASPGSPVYCAVTGHINTTIGFEILLPTTTWRQRYLQVGCGGLCGSIGISPPESTGYAPLTDGDFVLAAEDDGHSGNSTAWSTSALQRVQFAYLSYHDVALVSKGLAQQFYGTTPKYSYFDGCSQGGHEALTEAQRYPKDFNGVLAGAPASIMTELNSVLHEYTYAANYNSTGGTILDQPDANLELSAALKTCDKKVGLMLDYRACEDKFNPASIECSARLTTNCLTPGEVGVIEKIQHGPVDPEGQHLYPGGYSLGSEFNWSNGTSANLPQSSGGTVTPASFITDWLRYFAFQTDIGQQGVDNEPFDTDYFKQIEKLAPFWDATNPDLSAFKKAGGKLILWQGEADWSIPASTSIAYYQAVVKAMGGLRKTKKFAKYYLLPSVGHCGGNGPDTYNGLGAVVSWAEKHVSPHSLVATQYAPATTTPGGPGGGAPGTSDLTDAVPTLGAPATTAVVRTLPLYPYPKLPVYSGRGNVDQAANFVGRKSRPLQKPFPWLGTFDTKTVWCNDQGVNCSIS